jgi:hypothetical protein
LRIPGGKVENAEEVLWKAGVSNYSLFVVFEENEPMIPVVVSGGINDWEIELPLRGNVRILKQILKLLGIGIGLPERLFYNGEYIKNEDSLIGDLGIVAGSRIFISPCT